MLLIIPDAIHQPEIRRAEGIVDYPYRRRYNPQVYLDDAVATIGSAALDGLFPQVKIGMVGFTVYPYRITGTEVLLQFDPGRLAVHQIHVHYTIAAVRCGTGK